MGGFRNMMQQIPQYQQRIQQRQEAAGTGTAPRARGIGGMVSRMVHEAQQRRAATTQPQGGYAMTTQPVNRGKPPAPTGFRSAFGQPLRTGGPTTVQPIKMEATQQVAQQGGKPVAPQLESQQAIARQMRAPNPTGRRFGGGYGNRV